MAKRRTSDPPGPEPIPDINRLYQVPLDEFVPARTALAKTAGGTQAATIRGLAKPTLPAWAVNQLYWTRRDEYDQLVERARDLRATHDAALAGTRTDIRGASRAHEDAVERALKETLAILADSGHPVTDATRQAIATTLRGLPSDEAPGRLTRPLQPRGFEMLIGAAPRGPARVAAAPAPPKGSAGAPAKATGTRLAAAREAAQAAARERAAAEQAVRREEFAVARAARELERATRRVEAARQALEEAQTEMDAAIGAARDAERARKTADRRAAEAAEALEKARGREQTARADADTRT